MLCFGEPSLTTLNPKRLYNDTMVVTDEPTERSPNARQALRVVKRGLPARRIVVTADSRFSALEFLAAVSDAQLSVVTRLRLDAAPYATSSTKITT